jgi:hypothetical protein
MTEVKPNKVKKANRAVLTAGVIIEESISYTVQLTQQGHIIRLLKISMRFPTSLHHALHPQLQVQ